MHIYITIYFAIGIVFSIFFDQLLRRTAEQEPLTICEFIPCILFWPFVMFVFIKQIITSNK